jgi:bacterioferritin-associated ferredoxin
MSYKEALKQARRVSGCIVGDDCASCNAEAELILKHERKEKPRATIKEKP